MKEGDYVGVTVSGVAKPTTSDALAIYLQDLADSSIGLNRLIKYKWANADPNYITSGKTSFRCACTALPSRQNSSINTLCFGHVF